MSAPPRPVARAVSLASPFSPRRGRGAAARPLSTAALLDSADEGDDEEVDNAAAASCGPAEPADGNPDRPVTPEAAAAAAPTVKRSKGRIRRKNSKFAQQGPKFSDSGGGAAAASKGTADNGELVLSANAILDSLARLREQSDAKACAVTASDNVTTSTPSATSTSSPAAEDGPRADDDDKQEAESWSFRRRKGGAEGEASSRSYHRDCQEALQSLLWEPYDCRDPKDTPMYQYADDADVSLWLYPRPGLGGAKLSTRGGGEGCRCPCRCALHHSPSDSSSDCSSMSDTSPSSPTPVPLRETSASSLRGLLTASTSGGSSAADGWTAPRVTPGHQHQHQHHHHHHHHSARRQRHQASPRLVTDLKTPWIGTPATQPPRAASSLRGAPPAALGSPRASLSPPAAATAAAAAAAAVASVAPPPRSRQSETGRAGRRTLTPASPGSACSASYGHRRPGPNMLVNVSVPQDVSPCVVQVPSSGVSSVTVSGVVTSAVSSASSATSVCVPSPSVSAVPTIPCLNNVSNVHIHASSPTPRPRPRAAAAVTPASPRVPPPPPPASSGPRTYASTEAQTDDLEAEGRRERRRERRERRHLRRLQPRHPHPHPHGAPPQTAVLGPGLGAVPGEAVQVPDLLHSHLPPPYSTLPLGLPPHILAAPVASMPLGGPPPLVAAPHGAPPPQHPQLSPPPQPPPGHHRFAAPGLRLPFAFVPASRRR
ncbi:proline-rich protein 36-like [Frankliniella occidentalis]|uniref:Proline-rich protein 36-like n=1 Tax=Frankliniella occidentalis TaxID=133901 RepID=A0A9C6TPX7_FRAOC|nr:proline-rich protein 36-like [Frankliniella occidentalis]